MFQKGDKISFLDEEGTAIVVEVLTSNSCIVEDEFGFDRTVSFKDLVLHEPHKFDKIVVDKFAINKERKKASTTSKIKKHTPVVDLHMENLVDSHRNMTNHEIVLFQLEFFSKKLEGYMRNGVKEFIVVHGIGTGKLKQEVRYILHGYVNIEYMDDHYNSYGVGATRIFIH
jgi:dsDNA-specific endonuclease/ATPase MutS2